MNRDYYIDWLHDKEAAEIAAIERKSFPRSSRTGRKDIATQLSVAEPEGENLSIGLYCGARLVGYMLVFLEKERRNICRYTEVEPPEGMDLSGPGIYLADLAILPKHRGKVSMLLGHLMPMLSSRKETRGLPLDAFSRPDRLHSWTALNRMVARFGFKNSETYTIKNSGSGEPLYWVSFKQAPTQRMQSLHCDLQQALKDRKTIVVDGAELQVGHIDNEAAWELLEPCWDNLVRSTPHSTVFQSYDYQRLWWSHLGMSCRLFIVVVLRGNQPVAIAPLQIHPVTCFGKAYRSISFIVHPWENDRPRLLATDPIDSLIKAVLDHIFHHDNLWNTAYLHEQMPDDPFFVAWSNRLRDRGFVVSEYAGNGCAVVDISSSWETYLAGRSRGVRKGIKRRIKALEQVGEVHLETVQAPEQIERAMETYVSLECDSWKYGSHAGITKSSAYRAFCLELVRRLVSKGLVRVHFLKVGNHTMAGTFGLIWNQTFYSLHVTHAETYDEYSPGVVLTALELESVFAEKTCRRYDFLSGFLPGKRGWSTNIVYTTSLYAHSPDVRGHLFHLLYFRIKPVLRTCLEKFGLLHRLQKLKSRLRGEHIKDSTDS